MRRRRWSSGGGRWPGRCASRARSRASTTPRPTPISASRPRGSQISAWASAQSSVLPGRQVLEAAVQSYSERFAAGPVPRPEFWGGFRLAPVRIEFWQGQSDRLHDRLRYVRRADGNWRIERLAP